MGQLWLEIERHALSVLEAEVIDQVDLGTHTVFIGNVIRSEVLQEPKIFTIALSYLQCYCIWRMVY